MRISRISAVLLLLFVASSQGAEPEKRGFAGWISQDEATRIHIINLLLANGIKSGIWGSSFMWCIAVSPADEAKAVKLLREDAPKRGYIVHFSDDDQTTIAPSAEAKERLQRIAIKDALKQRDYSNKTALGRFFRSKEVSELAAKYPFLASLTVIPREYLITPKTLGTAYDLELRIRDTSGKRGKEYSGWFQVRDRGRVIEEHGSTEQGFVDD